MINHIENHISNLYNFYKKSAQEKQSLSDILNNFSQITENYKNTNNIKESIINKYSNSNLLDCTIDEQNDFIENILSNIKSLVIKSLYDKEGIIWTWKDIYNLLIDKSYSDIEKNKRKLVYPVIATDRPIGEESYNNWNGLQIIDLDIKNEELARKLKPILFNSLSKYPWFLGTCISASGKSLHIWTKITPLAIQRDECKVEYVVNFRHKYSYIYITLLQFAEEFGYTKEDIIGFIDMAMAKPQQGIFISSDFNPMVNTNFTDLRLDINFENAFHNGIESINWISHPDLKLVFRKLEWFTNDNIDKQVEVTSVTDIQNRDLSKNKKIHYKHAQRWQLANTLTSLYGEVKALQIMTEICADTPYKELKGDVKTAAIHNKPISLWGIQTLNKNHGFKIEIKESLEKIQNKEIEQISQKIQEEKDDSIDPTKILNDNISKVILHLKYNQYLSDIKDQIIDNLGKITLLEAGAGYGKTEMIKSLKDKTLLILPFTSTIKAKVESSEVTKDWLYYYGNKRPTLEELLGDKNMSMTIDKFARLNVMELDQANFKYIVIDESHLLYTSSYRNVMSPAIQRLANCQSKIIMMTGTPTGEILFFPGIKNIKVIKEDRRIKDVEINMCKTKNEKLILMCQQMADDIIAGKKIIYPCNSGNLYYEQFIGVLSKILEEKQFDRPLKSFYYKKSNYGDDSMVDIEVNKSIGNNDIIVCTNYLSVGVDICDKYTFTIYFSQLWIPQDIEQFANRVRNNDLYIKIFLEKEDSSGNQIPYNLTNPLNLQFDNSTLLLIKDLVQTCNDMIERNEEESKYNPIISSLLSTNNYIKYDENDAKYYIDETAFKLKIFEERYSDYSKQLNVLVNNLRYYGYTINIRNRDTQEEIILNEEYVDEILKECRYYHFCENTNKTFRFLRHIDDENIDIYKDILKGSYSIFTDDEYQEIRNENNIYAEDLEIVLKNLPIYLTLYKFYNPDTIIEIFDYCKEKKSNRINYSKLNRIKKFVIIEDNRRKKRIDFPIYKFIVEAQKFAKENPYISKEDIEHWLGEYTAKICNVIKNVVVDDIDYMETMYDLIRELFDVVVIKKSPKNGIIHIEPFTLFWDKKIDINDAFGGYIMTKEFFLQDLVDNMKPVESLQDDYIETYELPHTEKLTLDDVKSDIENIITKPYDYFKYSQLDGSNNRFMNKQKSTNHLSNILSIENDLFDQNLDDNDNKVKNKQYNLFDIK